VQSQRNTPLAYRSLTSGDPDWVLRLFDEEGSFARFQALTVRAMRLVVAAASLTRIRSLFERISNPPQPWEGGLTWVGGQPGGNGDERRLYRVLRRSLWMSLESEPAFASVLIVVERALPAALPNENAAWHTWKDHWPTGLTRVAGALSRLGAQEGQDPFHPEVSAFLVAQDATVNDIETLFRIASDIWRNQHSADAANQKSQVLEAERTTHPSERASGRRPVDLDYETAARTWQELTAEYDELGESRGPNQTDLSVRLTGRGIPISRRTLQKRIRVWRAAGRSWPPALSD
jgi:hypothetical protein